MGREWTLKYEVDAKCSTTKARAGRLVMTRGTVHTPVFMPVGTQGTMKGVTVEQMEELGKFKQTTFFVRFFHNRHANMAAIIKLLWPFDNNHSNVPIRTYIFLIY